MSWKIVQRRLGRAGGIKLRTARQSQWDREYGDGNWEIGYVIEGEFVSQERAFETIYLQSYAEHFETHPEDLAELIRTAKVLRNPHAEATTSVDLQVEAITEYLKRNGLALAGDEVVDIGTWEGRASHVISVRLSPLHVKATGHPNLSLENFWQSRKCLAIWVE